MAALREPLRTTVAFLDFKTNPINQVIDGVLDMDGAQNRNHLTTKALQQALPTEDDLRFQRAIQCTTCLNLGHSSLECTMRMHLAIDMVRFQFDSVSRQRNQTKLKANRLFKTKPNHLGKS